MRTTEDGCYKTVTESYAADACTFAEAEERMVEEIAPLASGDFHIKAIARAPYAEIFFSDADTDDRYYRAKLAFIALDEKTGKEKRTNTTYLVQAATLDKARAYIREEMDKTMTDYEVVSISETLIMDVFER